jgi:hypothetical protein
MQAIHLHPNVAMADNEMDVFYSKLAAENRKPKTLT